MSNRLVAHYELAHVDFVSVNKTHCSINEPYTATARLAQSAERKALNLVVVGSSPTVGVCPLARVREVAKTRMTANT